MNWFKKKDEKDIKLKPKPYQPTTELGRLEIWFAHNHRSTGFDLSAVGFYNYLKATGRA